MKTLGKLRIGIAAAASALCLAAFTGCLGGVAASSGDAATVNGDAIKEATITTYIEDTRAAQEMTDEDSWASWMASYGLTPETVREQVIDYYVDMKLTEQAAEQEGVSVSDDEVQEQIDKMKANYSSDADWDAALESAGLTEDSYRESLRSAMLTQALQDKIESQQSEEEAAAAQAEEDATVLSYVSLYAPSFDGAKRSSQILFSADDEATAREVLQKINSGEISFEDAAKQYSTDTVSAENGGDVGWDMLNSFVTEYTTALDGLQKDQVSDLVQSDYGWHIIKCTDVFTCPDEITSLDQVPSELTDYVRDMVASSSQNSVYTDWFNNFKDSADIVINDMPAKLPYDVDMSAYASDSAEGDATAAGSDASEAGSDATAAGSDASAESGDATAAGSDASAAGSDASAESGDATAAGSDASAAGSDAA